MEEALVDKPRTVMLSDVPLLKYHMAVFTGTRYSLVRRFILLTIEKRLSASKCDAQDLLFCDRPHRTRSYVGKFHISSFYFVY
jgi:hypothetical protein